MDHYRIMILDNPEGAAALRKTLEAAGFRRIDAFSDPAEAMAAFRNQKYHVLLADMDLPGMDGIEILKNAKQYDPMTQVIVMTGNSSLNRALTCLELGANDYLLKPLRNEEYVTEVVAHSVHKLERWMEAIRETVLRQSETTGVDSSP